jgi:hypothetical protein
MGSAVVTAWAAVIKGLQQLVQSPAMGPSTPAIDPRLFEHMNKALAQPQLPHATWKKLVLELKVGTSTVCLL